MDSINQHHNKHFMDLSRFYKQGEEEFYGKYSFLLNQGFLSSFFCSFSVLSISVCLVVMEMTQVLSSVLWSHDNMYTTTCYCITVPNLGHMITPSADEDPEMPMRAPEKAVKWTMS